MATYEKFIEYSPQSATRDLLDVVSAIVDEYDDQGEKLSLRQLFYQLVSRGVIENSESEYYSLSYKVTEARRAGILPWDVIVDRDRVPKSYAHTSGPAHSLRRAARRHRLDMWEGQEIRPEVWIEKVALIDVVKPTCRDLDVLRMPCKGNMSDAALWDAVHRHRGYEEDGQRVVVLHFADLDPSGVQMTETLQEKFRMFGTQTTVERVALTFEQVQKRDVPFQHVKDTDSKAAAYVEKIGTERVWEVDVLTPQEIRQMIREAVTAHRDDDLFNQRKKQQEQEREALADVADGFENGTSPLL